MHQHSIQFPRRRGLFWTCNTSEVGRAYPFHVHEQLLTFLVLRTCEEGTDKRFDRVNSIPLTVRAPLQPPRATSALPRLLRVRIRCQKTEVISIPVVARLCLPFYSHRHMDGRCCAVSRQAASLTHLVARPLCVARPRHSRADGLAEGAGDAPQHVGQGPRGRPSLIP